MKGRWVAAMVADLLASTIGDWVVDPDSDVEYAEWVENRWAVRMRQTCRESSTVWWWVGERSLQTECYLFPNQERSREEAFRLCLIRNASAWRCRIVLDPHGDLVIRSRIGLEHVSRHELELILGETYELVELTFPPLLRLIRS